MTAPLAPQSSASHEQPSVFTLGAYRNFTDGSPSATRVYKDVDLSVVVWNLEPGQVTEPHSHPDSAHAMIVLTGQGEYVKGAKPGVPIKAGDCVVVPREVVHTIRNTGSERLSYAAATNQGPQSSGEKILSCRTAYASGRFASDHAYARPTRTHSATRYRTPANGQPRRLRASVLSGCPIQPRVAGFEHFRHGVLQPAHVRADHRPRHALRDGH